MPNSHTPKFELRKHHGYKGLKSDIYLIGKPDTFATTAFHGWTDEQMEANAELIVRAVNTHERLVETLVNVINAKKAAGLSESQRTIELEQLLKEARGES